jgi:hypothetical protein
LFLAERRPLGPPGQVAAVAGQKDGGKQGEIGGILKELNYSNDQASTMSLSTVRANCPYQVYKF